jgi:hypothetical protein
MAYLMYQTSPMESKLATLSPTHLEVLLARPLRQVAAAAEVVATSHTIAQDSPCKYLDVAYSWHRMICSFSNP